MKPMLKDGFKTGNGNTSGSHGDFSSFSDDMTSPKKTGGTKSFPAEPESPIPLGPPLRPDQGGSY